MSLSDLIRWSGLAAVLSGVLLILGGITAVIPNAPDALAGFFFVGAHVFIVFAITGIYGRQIKATGILGFIGYIITMIGNVLFAALLFVGSFVFPILEEVEGAVAALESSAAASISFPLGIGLLLVGLLLLAIANMRAGVLPSGAGWLAFLGPLINILAEIAGLPDFVGSFVAPSIFGLGLAWFGVVLWSRTDEPALQAETTA